MWSRKLPKLLLMRIGKFHKIKNGLICGTNPKSIIFSIRLNFQFLSKDHHMQWTCLLDKKMPITTKKAPADSRPAGALVFYLKKCLLLRLIVAQITVHLDIVAGYRGMFLIMAAEAAKAVFIIILVTEVA